MAGARWDQQGVNQPFEQSCEVRDEGCCGWLEKVSERGSIEAACHRINAGAPYA